MAELFELLHDENDFFVQLASDERTANEAGIFIPVADEKAIGVGVNRQCREKLGLTAALDAEMPWLAGIQNLFHNLAKLVDFDREDAAVFCTVAHLTDRIREGLVDCLYSITQEVVKAHDERKSELALPSFSNHLHEVDLLSITLRINGDVAGGIDAEVSAAPALDIVEFTGIGDFKLGLGLHGFYLKLDDVECVLADGLGLLEGDPALGKGGAPRIGQRDLTGLLVVTDN